MDVSDVSKLSYLDSAQWSNTSKLSQKTAGRGGLYKQSQMPWKTSTASWLLPVLIKVHIFYQSVLVVYHKYLDNLFMAKSSYYIFMVNNTQRVTYRTSRSAGCSLPKELLAIVESLVVHDLSWPSFGDSTQDSHLPDNKGWSRFSARISKTIYNQQDNHLLDGLTIDRGLGEVMASSPWSNWTQNGWFKSIMCLGKSPMSYSASGNVPSTG